MDLHLDGKVILITGGTDGLGAALAGRLAGEGAGRERPVAAPRGGGPA
jgi:NAD(P)-dependent dehydrogenase (short-subunit alcohol dehydrogenase family)